MSNMNCPGQKANSQDWYDNYDRIFKKMQSVEYEIEMRYCRSCEKPCGEMTRGTWVDLWNEICDDCVTAMDKGEKV